MDANRTRSNNDNPSNAFTKLSVLLRAIAPAVPPAAVEELLHDLQLRNHLSEEDLAASLLEDTSLLARLAIGKTRRASQLHAAYWKLRRKAAERHPDSYAGQLRFLSDRLQSRSDPDGDDDPIDPRDRKRLRELFTMLWCQLVS